MGRYVAIGSITSGSVTPYATGTPTATAAVSVGSQDMDARRNKMIAASALLRLFIEAHRGGYLPSRDAQNNRIDWRATIGHEVMKMLW